MLFGQLPFQHSNERVLNLICNEEVHFPQDVRYKMKNGVQTVSVSEEARDIISKLLNKNPKKRLGYQNDFKEILIHPWFKEIDF